MKITVKANSGHDSFFKWYDSLSAEKQAHVDDLADDMGLPLYEDCTEGELAQLHDCSVSACDITSSYDPAEADTYVVKIWYEVEANAEDTYGPEAAEEIFTIVANSPQAAIEMVKDQWDGPIDRIEIVDINPEESEDDFPEIPFEASTDVKASKFSGKAEELHELVEYLSFEGISEHTMLEFLFDNMTAQEGIDKMKQLADECDVSLEEFYD